MSEHNIRIGKTIDEATKFAFKNLVEILRVGWLPIALAIGLTVALLWTLWQPLLLAYFEFFTVVNDATQAGTPASDVDFDFVRFEEAIDEIGFANFAVGYIGLLVITLTGYAIPMAAYCRMIILGEKYPGPFYLRLGSREINMALTYFAITLIVTAVMLAITMGGTLIIALLASAGGASEGAAVLGAFLLIILSIVAFIWLFARLALALPASAVEGGIPIARAWALSRGLGGTLAWIMLLGYLVLFVLSMVFTMIISMVTTVLLGVLTGMGSQIAPYLVGAIAAVGYIAVYCFGTALFMALFSGPYKTLTNAGPAD